MADFIGINNLIAGEVKEIQEAKGWMAVQTRFGLIKCLIETRFKAGDACKVTVRPEVATLCNTAERADDMNLIPEGQLLPLISATPSGMTSNWTRRPSSRSTCRIPGTSSRFLLPRKWMCFPVQITLGIPT